MNCEICGVQLFRDGHNAMPVKEGRCCDSCNIMVIVPERARRMGLL